MYFTYIPRRFDDIYTSINDDTTNAPNIISEKKVCLYISAFKFSFLLSFIIDLYNFIPLTEIASNVGINIMFWKSNDVIPKAIPFPVPNIATEDDIA